jgi:hypothetical protein
MAWNFQMFLPMTCTLSASSDQKRRSGERSSLMPSAET